MIVDPEILLYREKNPLHDNIEDILNDNFKGYLKKEYHIKFWKFFHLDIISEDRENGTYKHFISISFLKKCLVHVEFRTGYWFDKDTQTLKRDCKMGVVSKGYLCDSFESGKINLKKDDDWEHQYKIISTLSNLDTTMQITFSDEHKDNVTLQYYQYCLEHK